MDCREYRKYVKDKFIGILSESDERKLRDHLAECSECRRLFEQESQISTGIRGLDSARFRSDSIDAFGRLAVKVRSYRSPKPVLEGAFKYRRMRAASLAFAMLVIMLGLSSLNLSYSYTSGASMKISFDPPLKKLESLNTDEFNHRINSAIDNVTRKYNSDTQVSWAVAMSRDSLSSISVDVETDEISRMTDIYDNLLDQYPPMSLGQVSISPLKEETKVPVYTYMIARKKDTINEDEIRNVVNTDFQTIASKADTRIDSLESNSRKLRQAIEDELPLIRKIIRDASEKMPGTGGVAITSSENMDPGVLGGAQVPGYNANLSQSEYIKHEIRKVLETKGLFMTEQQFNRLLHVEYDAPFTRVMIGDTNDIFSPFSVGGWGLTIVRGSGANIRLNGYGEIVKSNEIDDVLSGIISPEMLAGIIEKRLENGVENEKILIEAWKGDTKADIIINPEGVKVVFPSESKTDEIPQETVDNDESTKGMVSTTDSEKTEREIVLRKSDDKISGKRLLQVPSYSDKQGILPEYISEDEIRELLEGKIDVAELESRIESRLKERKLDSEYQNIFLVRGGKTITINIIEGKAKINVNNWVSGGGGDNNSVVVTFKDKEKNRKKTENEK